MSIQIYKLKLYMIEFSKNGIIKAKKYFVNFIVRYNQYWSIIIIIYN